MITIIHNDIATTTTTTTNNTNNSNNGNNKQTNKQANKQTHKQLMNNHHRIHHIVIIIVVVLTIPASRSRGSCRRSGGCTSEGARGESRPPTFYPSGDCISHYRY